MKANEQFTPNDDNPRDDSTPQDGAADTASVQKEKKGRKKKAKKEKKKVPLLQSMYEWLEIAVFSFLLVLTAVTFVVRHSPVIGSSMFPTLQQGDVLLVSNLFYTPERGDIIVVQDNGTYIGLSEPLVKRVIAVGGDTIDIDFQTWVITVTTAEGETIVYEDEAYVNYVEGTMRQSNFPLHYPLTIEEGHIFVLGDNRNFSADSRDSRIGPIDDRYVVGHVLLRLFPMQRIGLLIGQ